MNATSFPTLWTRLAALAAAILTAGTPDKALGVSLIAQPVPLKPTIYCPPARVERCVAAHGEDRP